MSIQTAFLILIGSWLIVPPLGRWVHGYYLDRKRVQWITQQLAGRDPKALIEASPFGYGHWQGEDGYRIWDERQEPPFIGFGATGEACEKQILALIFEEEQLGKDNGRFPENR